MIVRQEGRGRVADAFSSPAGAAHSGLAIRTVDGCHSFMLSEWQKL